MFRGIDANLTAEFQFARDNGIDYWGPMMSEDELDNLLWSEDEVNEDLPTRLAEEMIHRNTRICVDLSAQGAAALAIGRSKPTPDKALAQLHNQYIVVDVANSRKRESAKGPVDGKLPRVTEDDVNTAVSSLDFPSTRVRATKLEGLILRMEDDPVESAFVNQLVVIQALRCFGVDAASLESYVEAEWGITFVRKLLTNVALAPTADVPAFVASGGRPPPVIYLSPNVTSRAHVAQSPAAEVEDAECQAAFWGRFKALSKMTLALCNTFRGKGSLRELKTHVNGNQVSKFDSTALSGYVATHSVHPRVGVCAGRLAHANSYDDFVRYRQALKSAMAAADRALAGESMLVGSIVRPKDLLSYVPPPKRRALMDPDLMPSASRDARAEWAAPSRISAVTMAVFHHTADHRLYEPWMAACSTYLMMRCCMESLRQLAPMYARLRASEGVSVWLSNINVARGLQIPEVEAACREVGSYARTVHLCLLARSYTHMQGHLADACWLAHSAARRKELPTSMLVAKLEISRYRIGGHWRMNRFVMDYLAKVKKVDPYKRGAAIRGACFRELSHLSVLGTSVRELASGAASYDAWESANNARANRVSQAADQARKAASMFASVRMAWSAYYGRKAKMTTNQLHLANACMGDAFDVEMALDSVLEPEPNLALIHYYGLVVEACVAIGTSLAYKYYKVMLNVPGPAATGGLEHTLEAYADGLKLVTSQELGDFLSVDPKLTQWPERRVVRSNLWKEAEARASALGRNASMLRSSHGATMDLIRSAYVAAGEMVRKTYLEMVANDWEIANNQSRAPTSSVVHAPHPVPAPILDYNAIIARMEPAHVYRDPEWVREMKTNLELIAAVLSGDAPGVSAMITATIESTGWGEFRLHTCKDESFVLRKMSRVYALMDAVELSAIVRATDTFREVLQVVHDKVNVDKATTLYS